MRVFTLFRPILVVQLVAGVVLLAFAMERAATAQEDGAVSYTSPTYGFSVTWDPADWRFSEMFQGSDTSNSIELEPTNTDRGRVIVRGADRYDGDSATCVADFDEFVRTDEDFSGVQQVEDANQLPQGRDSTASAALYTYTIDLVSSGPTLFARYLECRTLVEGEAVLVIDLEVARDDYDAALAPFDDLLASLTFGEDVEPNDALQGLYDDSYTNPEWGYSFQWDDESWTIEAIDHGLSYLHFVELENETTYALIEAEGYDYETDDGLSPQSCLQDDIESLESSDGLVDVEISREPGDFPAGFDPSGAAALVSYTVTDDDGDSQDAPRYVDYVECRSMNGGLAVLKIIFSSPIDDYEASLPAIEALLATITVPED